jgi:hypothetical protein
MELTKASKNIASPTQLYHFIENRNKFGILVAMTASIYKMRMLILSPGLCASASKASRFKLLE